MGEIRGGVFGEDLLEREKDVFAFGVDDGAEEGEHAVDVVAGSAGELPDADLGVGGWAGLFVVAGQLFVEFFTGADAGEFDGDVEVGAQATAEDHLAGEVEDADGLAHVKDEDFASEADGAGEHDELGGFGDSHEEALHVGVGDGDWAAGVDLLLEDGDDGAGGGEDVAEADGEESGRVPGVGIGGVEGLGVEFGAAFGGAHDGGGVDGFVGGDEDEGVAVGAGGGVGDGFGAENVVFDGFAGVGFHHGDVFVGGAVEDDVGVVLIEEGIDAGWVADVGQEWADVSADPKLAKFAVDFEEGVFGALEEEETVGAELHDLAADFGADAPAGAGDQDGFGSEEALEFGGFEADGWAAEEVGDVWAGARRGMGACGSGAQFG